MEVHQSTCGVISADASYTLHEFKKRMGLTDSAYRRAKARGLKIRVVGKRRFVVGSDWIEYLKTTGEEAGYV